MDELEVGAADLFGFSLFERGKHELGAFTCFVVVVFFVVVVGLLVVRIELDLVTLFAFEVFVIAKIELVAELAALLVVLLVLEI